MSARTSAKNRIQARNAARQVKMTNARRIKDYLASLPVGTDELHESSVFAALSMNRDQMIRAMPFVVTFWGNEETGSSIQRTGGGVITIERDPNQVVQYRDASRLLHSVETRTDRLVAMLNTASVSLDQNQMYAYVTARAMRDSMANLAHHVDSSLETVAA